MKKRLLGFIFIMSLVLASSMTVFADAEGRPYPRPPHSFSVDLNEAE